MGKLLGARKEAILLVKDEEGQVIEEYRALFTTRALADAEQRIGKSMTQVLNGFVSGRSGVREIALLLQAGMEAERRASKSGGAPVSYGDACDVIDLVGINPAAESLNNAIVAVLSYGKSKPSSVDDDQGDEPKQPDEDTDPNA